MWKSNGIGGTFILLVSRVGPLQGWLHMNNFCLYGNHYSNT